MVNQDTPVRRWNIFARELEDILAARGVRLEDLDNQLPVLPEKVRLLSQSLLQPGSFPLLSYEEMEQVIQKWHLNDAEVMRLRAAILAASIEEMLMERIDQDDALLAAEQLFPIVVNALQKQVTGMSASDTTWRGDLFFAEDTGSDLALGSAQRYTAKATAELHLSRNVALHAERIDHAYQARQYAEKALAELDDVDNDIRAMRAWYNWFTEAKKRLEEANARLEDLGEEVLHEQEE